MRKFFMAGLVGLSFAAASVTTLAQVAGSSTVDVVVEQTQQIALGWSAKKQFLGRPVHNENGQKVGVVDDVIIATDDSTSIAILRVGSFFGKGKHQVAIPVSQFSQEQGKLVLAGATKAALKDLPAFEYSSAP